MADDAYPGLTYVIGFDLPFHTILEMLLRSSVSFGGVVNVDHHEGERQVMQALTDGNGRNKKLVESALSVLAGRRVMIIVYEDLYKAFLAFCHVLVPDVCPFQSIPRRLFDAGSLSQLDSHLRIGAVIKEHIMCRWDDRELDLKDEIDGGEGLARPNTSGQPSASFILPPEVLEVILGNLRVPALEEDRPLWWIPFSLDVMKSIVDLNAAGLAFQVLLRNPEWRGYVRRLYCNFPLRSEGLNDKEVASLITGCVQYLGHLEGLHFDNVNTSFASSSILTSVRLPTGLQSVGFRVIGFGRPALNQDGINAQMYTPPCAFPLPDLTQLRTLCLSGVSLFHWARNPSFSRLRRLYLHWMQLHGTAYHGFFAQLLLTPVEVLAMSRMIMPPMTIMEFAVQSQTLRAFSGGDLANPRGETLWGDSQYQALESVLGRAVDRSWTFPHTPYT